MKWRIFSSICLVALVTVLLSSLMLSGLLYDGFFERMKQDVKSEAMYLAAGLDIAGQEYLSNVKDLGVNRITLVASDGTVLYDSAAKAELMDNHLNRQEIAAALEEGYGESVRLSKTLDTQTFYYALRLKNGSIVRVANTVDSIYASLFSSVPFMLLIIVISLSLAVLLASWQTSRIVAPINAIDLEHPTSNAVYDELSPLLLRIAKQNTRIQEQMDILKQRQEEFIAITENMREGLIILNSKGAVLSINQSAMQVFDAVGTEFLYRHILTLNRNLALQQVVEQALLGQPAQGELKVGERNYQVLASPVWIDDKVSGAILLIIDVTEKYMAEQMRKEFSANVSHELKTPLTSISGYAEIMKNGLAKPEDMPRFAEKIYDEAHHLIALVEDIIKLSHLDESNTGLPREHVELLAVAEKIRSELLPLAKEKHVTVAIEGERATVYGTKRILETMIYNLCENAIKYNRENGKVTLSVFSTDNDVILKVADTGIGISSEHHERVFERFYRVDKSHSKATGGTGLGLSIVKRGAMYHNAKVELESEPDVGTTITIRFPV